MENEINQCSPLKLKELNLANASKVKNGNVEKLKYTPIEINKE
jgi:hypothetical protein